MFTLENGYRIALTSLLLFGAVAFFWQLNQKPAPQPPTLEQKFAQLQSIQGNMRTNVCNLEGSKKSFEEVAKSLSGTTPDLQLELSPIYDDEANPRLFFREKFRQFDCK